MPGRKVRVGSCSSLLIIGTSLSTSASKNMKGKNIKHVNLLINYIYIYKYMSDIN